MTTSIKRITLPYVVILSSLALVCRESTEPTTKSGIVALYSGAGTWEESVTAARNMFEWMGCSVELVSADEIRNGGLANFRILCVPGGNMYQYAEDIAASGAQMIKEFISKGGGYIGLCGGAYYASEKVIWQRNQLPMTPLGIFSGVAEGPFNEIVPYPNYTMSKVNITNRSHPITNAEPDFQWMLYYWGPALKPNTDANISVLGRYDRNNQPVMLAFEYGNGRVFLIGTHPEIEEDSDRDGVVFADELDDQGSDWELLKKAVLWCLEK